MRSIEIPYGGDLLLSHLIAFGLAVAVDAENVPVHVHHSQSSLSFEPIVEVSDEFGDAQLARAVRATAVAAELAVETDLAPDKKGNDRRSVIWARGSYANDPRQAEEVVKRRAAVVDAAAARRETALLGVLAGLGAPASWGPDTVKPAHGATALDGVLGNHTSDLVRGVLRPARAAAATLDAEHLWAGPQTKVQLDKTGWAPAGTPAPLAHQWLAVLGLALLPVAHRQADRSATPAAWSIRNPRSAGIALPLLSRAASFARVRAVLELRALVEVGKQPLDTLLGGDADLTAGAELRSLGVPEIVRFERQDARGQGSSVAFSFRRGVRVTL